MLDLSIARVKLEPLAESLVERTPIETWPLLAGWISFGSSCAASTFCQKMVGISTGTRPPLPTALGMATVCAASMISHQAAIAIHLEMERWKNSRRHLKPSPSLWQRLSPEIRDKFDVPREFQSFLHSVKDNWKGDSIDLGGLVQTPKHKLRICMVGLLAFQIFGGRFWGISPSSYTHIGSFARQGIPATERYANAAQRKKIEQLGRTFGCHTCGSNQRFSWLSSFHFVGDHQPPKAVANQINARWYNQLLGRSVPFKFYPQCRACSNKQGSILSAAALQNSKSKNFLFSKNNNLAKAGGGRLAHFHGLRPRWNHFAGSVVAGVTVVDATDEQIAEGNPKRYRDWHRQAERFCKSLLFY